MRHMQRILACVLLFIAGAFLFYPWASIIINNECHSNVETNYTAAIENTDDAELTAQREAAQQYNAMLSGVAITEGGASAPPLAYAQQLTVGGVMAYVDIPKIGAYLPVQHGTDAVLSAHSGMASSKLFSDIDQLAVGDTFYIHVLGDTLAYQVDNIATVLPTDTGLLQIEGGKDLVTLVTCTPFGVNTHRLLVRGHRVPYTPETVEEITATPASSSWARHYLTGLAISFGAAAVVGGGYFIVKRRKRYA